MLVASVLLSLAVPAAGHAYVPSPAVASPAIPASFDELPVPTQGVISATLGSESERYLATPAGDGFTTRNEGHGFRADYGPGGLTVVAGDAEIGLRLAALGRGRSLQPVETVAPHARANRVEFAHAGVTAWYANGPLGLQQGFTLEQRPAGASDSRLALALQLSGPLAPRLDGGDVLLIAADGEPRLRYHGLTAIDAEGRTLPATLVLDDRRLRLEVDDRGARYPVLIDPFIQAAKLRAQDGTTDDFFGFSVAISRDTIVVGAKQDDVGANVDQGSAYVFVRPALGWATATESAKLTAANGRPGDQFGISVAVSGNDVFVGAWNVDNVGIGGPGAVFVFTRPAGGWAGNLHETARLEASDRLDGDLFGGSVAASGNVLVVGAPFDDFEGGGAQGSAYVFVRPFGGWVTGHESAKLSASDKSSGDRFGSAVAVSGDTVVVGTFLADIGGQIDRGAAYVFVDPGWFGSLEETAKLTAADGGTSDGLGFSVGVSGDTVVAGSILHLHAGGVQKGAAYVFVRPAAGWVSTSVPTAELLASDGQTTDRLGESIAIARNTVIVGARSAGGPNHQDQGAAYMFVKPAAGWVSTSTFDAKLTAADGAANDCFGCAVAFNGAAAVVGAWGHQFGTPNVFQGATYVFVPALALARRPDGLEADRAPRGEITVE
jgi:hypothetical protein